MTTNRIKKRVMIFYNDLYVAAAGYLQNLLVCFC